MSPLPAQLPITPFIRPVGGEVTLPGSKSLTNRALLLAALCDHPVKLTGALFSDDTDLMAKALRALGFDVTTDAAEYTAGVSGQGNAFQLDAPVDLFVGLAGTAARFLTALCASAPRGVYRIDGVPQMRKRPMKGLIDTLRALGADIRCTGDEGFFPIEIRARGLDGGSVDVDATASSQILSALLMVAPLARDTLEIGTIGGVRPAFVEMTTSLMAEFGMRSEKTSSDRTRVGRGAYHRPTGVYRIEPDATAASYFLALPLVTGGTIHINDLADSRLQGDTRFIDVLRRTGVVVASRDGGIEVGYQRATLRTTIGEQNFNEFSDTFLTLAALAPLLDGPTKITGIAHTRKQETDRVAGMASELRRLGQHVVETEDSLEIHPRPLLPDQVIDTHHDHRFAMSFGILGCHDLHGDGRPWLTIGDPACCGKTFPHFFDVLETLRSGATSPTQR